MRCGREGAGVRLLASGTVRLWALGPDRPVARHMVDASRLHLSPEEPPAFVLLDGVACAIAAPAVRGRPNHIHIASLHLAGNG